jgi:hypothetical protein
MHGRQSWLRSDDFGSVSSFWKKKADWSDGSWSKARWHKRRDRDENDDDGGLDTPPVGVEEPSVPGEGPTAPVEPSPSQPEPAPAQPGPGGVELTRSTTPIRTTHDGQVIENIDLYVTSGDAITVMHDNVVIRNSRIHHEEGSGIVVDGARNVTIEYSEVINSSPPSGIDPETSTELYNILAYQAPDLNINNVTLRDGSSGVYLLESPNATLSQIEGYNFHGPFPRGQFVQFDKSEGGSLSDFYVVNDPNNSYPEDIISVYHSPNVTISRGLIDGNNSTSGVGVMFEGNSAGGRVENVDAVNQGNGAFSSYSPDVTFEATRSFDNIHGDQGRGWSESDALIWNVSNSGISISNSTYTNAGNPGNIVWDESKAVFVDVTEAPNATPMAPPVVNQFEWA